MERCHPGSSPSLHFLERLAQGRTLMRVLQNSTVMVVHGPEIFDSGDVSWLMDCICPRRTIVTGVMARTAAEESNLPVEFCAQPPSRVITALDDPVFLANRGKTPESGQVFGDIVASRLGNRGLVHLECSSRTVFVWNGGDRSMGAALSSLTGFDVKEITSTSQPQARIRQIRGCIPGEAVFINGIVIGRATEDVVVVQRDGGTVVPVSGLEPKPQGIAKLVQNGDIDITTAWCKSGMIRTAVPRGENPPPETGRILVIDHCGHEIYSRMTGDCCGVFAIGDDTTAVCGHICTHRGIPVLGIVDGDQDAILPSAFAPGSVVMEALFERDDDIGNEIRGRVPEETVTWLVWVQEIITYLKGRIRVVIDLREEHDAVH